MFGAVVEGMDVVRRIESVGSKSGKCAAAVTVMDCGQLDAELVDDGHVSAAGRALLARQREEEARAARETRLPGVEEPDAASARRLMESMGHEVRSSNHETYVDAGDYRGGKEPKVGGGLSEIAGRFFEAPSGGKKANAGEQAAEGGAEGDKRAAGREDLEGDLPVRAAGSALGGGGGIQSDASAGGEGLTPKQRKLFELRLKLNESRKANQVAVVEEKKRKEAPEDYERQQKKKLYETLSKRRDEIAEARGIDPTKKHLLMTAEQAAEEYKRKDKKSKTASGGEVFSKHNLFNAYDKRTKNIKVNAEEYAAAKAADPHFYSGSDNLAYGGNGAVPQEAIDRMAAELEEQKKKRLNFSRRRKHYEERDVTHINDRNAHFNKKLDRAFGEHTREIKANLERGTALPEH